MIRFNIVHIWNETSIIIQFAHPDVLLRQFEDIEARQTLL